MVAKLSKLQRAILSMAYERHGRVGNGVDLYYAEILAEYFRFPALSDPSKPGSWHFSRAWIGPAEYDAAQASLSRAVRRLETRGLVTVYTGAISRWTGLSLTTEGLALGPTDPSPNRTETASTPRDPEESEPFVAEVVT